MGSVCHPRGLRQDANPRIGIGLASRLNPAAFVVLDEDPPRAAPGAACRMNRGLLTQRLCPARVQGTPIHLRAFGATSRVPSQSRAALTLEVWDSPAVGAASPMSLGST